MPTAYATYEDMVLRYDTRALKDLVSDTGVPEPFLDLNSVIDLVLSEATGILNSAVQVGNSYTDDQIAELLAAGGTGADHLKGLVCSIAMALLLRRRPEKYKAADKRLEDIERNYLDPIRHGRRIFGVPGRAAVGSVLTGDEITESDIHQINPITHRTRHYYPRRESSLPRNRS